MEGTKEKPLGTLRTSVRMEYDLKNTVQSWHWLQLVMRWYTC